MDMLVLSKQVVIETIYAFPNDRMKDCYVEINVSQKKLGSGDARCWCVSRLAERR